MAEIKYTRSDVNRMNKELGNLENHLDYLKENNDNGQYNTEIKSTENKISGLKYSLSGKN